MVRLQGSHRDIVGRARAIEVTHGTDGERRRGSAGWGELGDGGGAALPHADGKDSSPGSIPEPTAVPLPGSIPEPGTEPLPGYILESSAKTLSGSVPEPPAESVFECSASLAALGDAIASKVRGSTGGGDGICARASACARQRYYGWGRAWRR